MSEENCHIQSEFSDLLKSYSPEEWSEILDVSERVQTWSLRGTYRTPRYGTFAQAAHSLGVPVERIALAVEAHYWMFADDPSAPIGERQIEHEGE